MLLCMASHLPRYWDDAFSVRCTTSSCSYLPFSFKKRRAHSHIIHFFPHSFQRETLRRSFPPYVYCPFKSSILVGEWISTCLCVCVCDCSLLLFFQKYHPPSALKACRIVNVLVLFLHLRIVDAGDALVIAVVGREKKISLKKKKSELEKIVWGQEFN